MDWEITAKPATYCDECAHRKICTLQFAENKCSTCPILKGEDEPILYRNSEGYSDPTAYFALRDVVREEKRHHNANRTKKRHHRILVVYYDD